MNTSRAPRSIVCVCVCFHDFNERSISSRASIHHFNRISPNSIERVSYTNSIEMMYENRISSYTNSIEVTNSMEVINRISVCD